MRLRPLAIFALLAAALLLPAAPRGRAQVGFINLLRNGGFEQGASGWEGVTGGQVVQGQARAGARSLRITAGEAAQGWVEVAPGQTYVLTLWFRWSVFEGSQWGSDHITVQDDSFTDLAKLDGLHERYERGVWHKLALTVVAPDDRLRVSFGMFGPQDRVELHFDDVALFARGSNQPPTASPTASVSSGAAPLSVRFQAGADDVDGAVRSYQWHFGDGTEAREASPVHIYRTRGDYTAVLRVWDQDGALATRSVSVRVSDTVNPELTIATPTSEGAYTTEALSIALAGQATTPTGQIAAISWDNLRTGDAGALPVTPARTLSWATPAIALAAGANEILVSAIDSRGRAHSDRVVVTRQVAGPQIYGLEPASAEVRQYEQYELRFQVATVSAYPLFRYDERPPQGVEPGLGVSVEGVITTPSGRTVRQPAFYRTDAERRADAEGEYYEPTARSGWSLRFAPTEVGVHQVVLAVRDASGAATLAAGSFTATAPRRPGFIQVSQADPRYFRFSDGSLFWPIGPAWAVDGQGGQGFNFDRPWMAGLGAYSSNWARWKSTAQILGNEGFSSQLSFREHYPGHELAQELFYPDGYRMWLGGFIDEQFHPRLRPSTTYQVQIRLKLVELKGPREPGRPFGLVAKLHGWPEEPGFEADNRAAPSLFPRISVDRDWHTVVATYRTGADEGSGTGRSDLSIYLENVTAGRAYIDAFSVRELLAGGARGPELIRNPRADLHTYVEQRPAAALDEQLARGEREGIYYKYVVHDKNDWVQSRLLATGAFADSGDGYYQPGGTKARWLLEQWWRYIIARWGSSTAVHSWELNNEGPPDDGSGAHARMAQEFASFMRANDAHPHLATTSFWCCWRPTFWGDRRRFPDLGYADIHQYITPADTFADGTPMVYDEARFQAESSLAYASDRVGVPIMRGELGFNDEPVYSQLERPNAGVWFHNLLWAQLNAGAVFDPGYWHRSHFEAIEPGPIARAFGAFVATLDLQRGGYGELEAAVSNPGLRVYGQKHRLGGRAFLWVQNRLHTWRNVMGVNSPAPIAPQSGTITMRLTPGAIYTVEWWDTRSGQVARRELLVADPAGQLTLTITALRDDLAIKLARDGADRAVYMPELGG